MNNLEYISIQQFTFSYLRYVSIQFTFNDFNVAISHIKSLSKKNPNESKEIKGNISAP